MKRKPTLVVAQDHEILRVGLARLLSEEAGYAVVACVGDAQSAVNACTLLRPDLLLIDIEMPGRDVLGAIQDVRVASPKTRIVILTSSSRSAVVELTIRAGAWGYLLKSDSKDAILAALDRVLWGRRVYSAGVRGPASARKATSMLGATCPSALAGLTPRELEVLRYIGRGSNNDAMARAMHLSKRTVERHVSRLMHASTIHDRSALMKLAYDQGLVV
ncbi:MAG: response regulator transcription factor [Planctomycetota bacterium]